MRPASLILSDVERVIDRQAVASLFGLNVNDLAGGLLQKLSDDGVNDTSALMDWVRDLVGRVGIARVLQNLQLKFDQGEPTDVLLSFRSSWRRLRVKASRYSGSR